MKRGIKIETYEHLNFYVNMFKHGRQELLIIVSRAGLGKTCLVNEMLKDVEFARLDSHITPYEFYQTCLENRNKPIVIDDVDALLHDSKMISLIKQVTETNPVKRLSWHSQANEKNDLPSSFETTSKVIIIANTINSMARKVKPLLDRGYLLNFQPSLSEVFLKIEEIKDEIPVGLPLEEKNEVFEFFKVFGRLGKFVSIRSFKKGLEFYLETDGKERWQDELISVMGVDKRYLILHRILLKFRTEKECIREWERQVEKGDSRRSFYRYKAVYQAAAEGKEITEIIVGDMPKNEMAQPCKTPSLAGFGAKF